MIAALAIEVSLTPNAERQTIKLFPAGEFRGVDGRPAECAAWILDSTNAELLVATALTRQTRYVVDYEHQTLKAAENGKEAPASGWFKTLEWREGDGLYAVDVEWTAKAAAHIAAKEYLYLSPVFLYGLDGRVLKLLHVALTNTPALDELPPLSLAALSRLACPPPVSITEENPVKREELIAMLGLAATATDVEITTAMAALKAKADSADAQIAALSANQVDPAKFVSVDVMRQLQGQIASLTAQTQASQTEQLLTAALSDGRLLPAQEAWARDLAKTNAAALTAYLDTAPKIAALTATQTGGKPPVDQPLGGLDDTTLAVCKAFGNSVEDVQKTIAAGSQS